MTSAIQATPGLQPAMSGIQPGMAVYVQDDNQVWLDGHVTAADGGCYTVKRSDGKTEYNCRTEHVLLRPEMPLVNIGNLTELAPINQASVLACLHERYSASRFYTGAGTTVVAVNPFCSVPELYSRQTALAYHRQDTEDAHIYRISAAAYSRMVRGLGHVNQSIIVSGESGAGKTVTAKHLVRYMTLVSTSDVAGDSRPSSAMGQCIERQILDSNPILEAFGNAVTQRNDNSSRFGKYIQLQFARTGQVRGASIRTYLLEKTRVVHQSPGECNFHIFYQIINALKEDTNNSLSNLVNEMGPTGFKILPRDKDMTENRQLSHTLDAMAEVGLSSDVQNNISKVLVAILFLGNVEFTPYEDEISQLLSDKDDQFCDTSFFELEVTETAMKTAADLLGISTSTMEQVFLYRSIASGGNTRRSIFIKPVPQREAYSRRDCLATVLYSRLFEWLVTYINSQLEASEFDHTIGLLDIYGFEVFDNNSLEQLCINYANEKLQQHYVRHFLKDLQNEYEEECIDWKFLTYTDNQACLDILEGQPSVFGLLNEDVQLNRKSDTISLCERILSITQARRDNSPPLKKPKTFMKTPAFAIVHYAGTVTYNGEGLTTKNKDSIPEELISMLKDSSNTFVSALFEDFHSEDAKGRKRKTVLGKFKASLDSLLSSLISSDIHYIRCIKPNPEGRAAMFVRPYVMSQLAASGIIETVKISEKGFPARMAYGSFLQRYGLIMRNSSSPPPTPGGEGEGDAETLYDPLDALLKRQLEMSDTPRRSSTPRKRLRRRAGVSGIDHTRRCCAAILTLQLGSCRELTQQFGRTKLFLHQVQIEKLENTRLDVLSQKARQIQWCWRGYVHRRRHRCRVAAAIIVQRAWRRYMWRRDRRRVASVLLVQKSMRMHLARLRFKKLQVKKRSAKRESWKPIMDRKRTSPGSRSRPSSRSSKRSSPGLQSGSGENTLNSFSFTSDSFTSVASSWSGDSIGLSPSTKTVTGDLIGSSPASKTVTGHFIGLSPTVTTFHAADDSANVMATENNIVSSQSAKTDSGLNIFTGATDNKTIKNRVRPVRGPFSSLQNRNNENGCHGNSDAPPLKKMRTVDGSVTTLKDLNVGDGILTRRRLPKVPIRFHTRASVLKHAHIVHQRELTCSVADCLPGNVEGTRQATDSQYEDLD